MIRFEDVTKAYRTRRGEVRAIDGLTLHIAPGEFVAVRGHSGSGKSTLLALAGGLATPTLGNVVVAGETISSMSPGERARFRAENVGFVFQMFHLLPYLTVLDNVLVAAEGSRHQAEAHAAALLEDFGMGHRLTHRPGELSAGERQRVAMARAMLNRPRLMLADEPTGNLDPKNAAGLLDLLCNYHAAGGTVLLVTHDDKAAARAGRVISLEDGRLV